MTYPTTPDATSHEFSMDLWVQAAIRLDPDPAPPTKPAVPCPPPTVMSREEVDRDVAVMLAGLKGGRGRRAA